MNHRWLVPCLLLFAALLACGPALPATRATATPTLVASATHPAAGPTATRRPLSLGSPTATPPPAGTQAVVDTPAVDTPAPADTEAPVDTEAPSDTPVPSRTPKPARTATASPTVRPPATATATRKPAPAGPSFLDTVVAVKKQVENFGGQIDIAVGSGQLDCQETVNSYEYVAARTTINFVPASLQGAYGLYTQGVTLFLTKSKDLYTNCKNFLANPNGGTVPALQWTVARTSVNDASQLLRQAIIAAGGTP